MNRVFKFRVWDKTVRHMRYLNSTHDTFMFKEDGSTCFYNLQNGSGGDEYDIMQFVGLYDKNGKEIYEGDILHCISRLDSADMIVMFEGGQFRIVLCGKVRRDVISSEYYDINCFKKEIIGNIYENPELLEVQQ